MHIHHLFRSWPVALCLRTKALSSNAACEAQAMNELRWRFVNNFAPDEQLSMISDDGYKHSCFRRRMDTRPNTRACFGFHPVILGAVSKAFRKNQECPYRCFMLKDAFGLDMPKIGVSWYSKLPKMGVIITKQNEARSCDH